MTAIQQRRNLLFSLPDVLMIEVYEFDTTYRVFNTEPFRKELGDMIRNNTYKPLIMDYVLSFIDDGEDLAWANEYGYLGCNETTDGIARVQYTEDNFEIHLHSASGLVYYKILPKGATKDTCDFLRNPRRFDGFVCHANNTDDFYSRMSSMDLRRPHADYVAKRNDLCLWW